ncbi:hypothetical protein [Pedobacter sp. Hv1]|uniref:hypothetical protein n=1 Tax=Pedobacter sp. Hv1 TaxID=1740090 RepID=UPI0006D89780|nr:hypothetical protein [Pedobacter sp. Hv1]KQC02285.1 hypothetical protein AQF98_01535 [Pedobacter sp. Hv1]
MKITNSLIFTLITSVLFYSCIQTPKQQTTAAPLYPTVSYLDIKLDSTGKLPSNPYVLTFKNGKKEIIFCGVNHLTDDSDISNPMFAGIEQQFFASKPEVCVNEGGDLSKKVYASKKEALLQDGEIGLVKILADSLKIKTVNGDIQDSLEFKSLLKQYTKGEFLAYIVTERLMWGLKGARITDSVAMAEKFDGFIKNYIMKKGAVQLSKEEQTLAFYKANYEKLLNRPFALETLAPTNPFDPKGKFQQIGRKSKEIRDQYLLQTIDQLLDKQDKVFVVFGGWHLLTCEPGLKAIIDKKR